MIKFKEEPFHLNCHKTFLVSLLLSEQNTFDCEGKTKQHNLIFIDWAQQIMINLYHFSIVKNRMKPLNATRSVSSGIEWSVIRSIFHIQLRFIVTSHLHASLMGAEGGWKILSSELGLEASSNFRSFKERAAWPSWKALLFYGREGGKGGDTNTKSVFCDQITLWTHSSLLSYNTNKTQKTLKALYSLEISISVFLWRLFGM